MNVGQVAKSVKLMMHKPNVLFSQQWMQIRVFNIPNAITRIKTYEYWCIGRVTDRIAMIISTLKKYDANITIFIVILDVHVHGRYRLKLSDVVKVAFIVQRLLYTGTYLRKIYKSLGLIHATKCTSLFEFEKETERLQINLTFSIGYQTPCSRDEHNFFFCIHVFKKNINVYQQITESSVQHHSVIFLQSLTDQEIISFKIQVHVTF